MGSSSTFNVIRLLARAASEGDTTSPPDVSPAFDLVSLYSGHLTGKRLATAFLTWVVYDFVLTMDDSIELFWIYGWSASKLMYLTNRYNILLTLSLVVMKSSIPSLSPTYCKVTTWMELLGSFILVVVVSLAMVTRVCALWNRNKWIVTSVFTVFAINIISYLVMVSYAYAKGIIVPLEPPFTGCLLIPGWDRLWIIFPISLAFETLIVLLTVYKSWSVAIQHGIRTPLYTMLFEDGVSYYSVIMAAQILSFASVMVLSSTTIPVVTSYPLLPVAGIACSRLLIRLQRILLNKNNGQSIFSSLDIWSANSPEFTFGGGRMDYEGGNLRFPQRLQADHHAPGVIADSTSNTKISSLNAENDIVMDKIVNTTKPPGRIHADGTNNESLTTAHSNTKGREIQHQVPGVEITVKVNSEGPGPLIYGSRQNVLDASFQHLGEASSGNRSKGVGSLTVSRMGRYD